MFKQGHGMFGGGGSHSEEEEVFLNLTPMIDILTCLLFFLLLSFGAVIIALINASVPVQAGADETVSSADVALTMAVVVNDSGFVVSASSDKLSDAELDKLKRELRKGKDYPYKELHEYLWQVKNRFPKSRSVIITPTSAVPYEVLIKIMDATRDRRGGTARRPIRVPMFPEAVVSTRVE